MNNEIKPLVLDEEEAYLLNHLWHIGISTVYQDGREVKASTLIAAQRIVHVFNEESWDVFQKKMNDFFNQFAVDGDTITEHRGNSLPGTMRTVHKPPMN